MRPIHDMLTKAAGRMSCHMPGHKGASPFASEELYALDTTELPMTDDLYCPENGILQAEELYARAAGSAECLFLHGGSTAGIHVMLQLWAGEGDTVLLPRNAHLSAVNACVIGGLKPVWIPVTQLPDGYFYIREEAVLAAMDAHPEAKTLLLTRPDFYGGCMPLDRIIRRAHDLGMRVVVDEAHGAHFPWMKGMLSAGALGADAWTQSVHKTLPGLTGAAVLHLKRTEDRGAAMRILRREQTSSPSFLLMMSIDDARAYMEAEGARRLAAVAETVDLLRRHLPMLGYEDAHAGWQAIGQAFDPTRLVLHAPQGGDALAKALRAEGVDAEMNDLRRVVLILTCMDTPQGLMRLLPVLRRIRPEARLLPELPRYAGLPRQVMLPRQAAIGAVEAVAAAKASGRVAAAAAGLYPPGIPLVMPGEELDDDTAMRLAEAAPRNRFGMEGDSLLCVR